MTNNTERTDKLWNFILRNIMLPLIVLIKSVVAWNKYKIVYFYS